MLRLKELYPMDNKPVVFGRMRNESRDERTEKRAAKRGAENRWEHLVEHIHDAVVEFELLDGEPVVRDVNRAFVDCFGYERAAVVGGSLNEHIVPEWLADEASALDEQTDDGEINYRRVRRQTADGLREFLYRGIPIPPEEGRTDGFAVYTDLTDITRQERRLDVLNRVLRHNLRNRATTIAGNTSRLLAEVDDRTEESARAAATVEREAEALRKLAEEATRIRHLTEARDVGGSMDCVPLLRDCLADCRRSHPGADVREELPASADVRATQDLRIAVESLLENAVEHNPAPDPIVGVRIERAADGWIDVCVEDDGPAIPASQRRIVTGEADITPLRHSKGIGLWLVKWTAERLGGELSFESSAYGGNSVRIRIPSAE